ncbi:MAG: hypothetical protein IJU82_01010 [Ruminiclostridium sp.]|nr:hypothetical protein [Ruminiclostridium sp.]
MEDIEIMKRAKQYMESLANGIDPLTGNELDENDIVNNVRISRCLFYTAGILQKVIDNGGEVQREKLKRSEKAEFSLTDEQALALKPDERSTYMSNIIKNINSVIDDFKMKKLQTRTVNNWLIDKGLLNEVIINGRARKNPTPEGEALGITLYSFMTENGMTKTCIYSPEAQQFIFDNIDAIIAFAAEEEEEKAAAKAERKRLAAEDTEVI